MGRKKKKPVKPWCWYCNREFEDEKILIQHQKAKHFKCHICFKKLYTGPGLAIHCMQVHKVTLDKVPNALSHRNNIDVEIYGMEGIPEKDVKEHERQRHGYYKGDELSDEEASPDGAELEPSRAIMPGMPMPGMIPGMPSMPGMMPGMPRMGFPPMPGAPPMGPMGHMAMGLPPGFMPPVGSMPMMGGMPNPNMPPSTATGTIQAPAKPLFPAAVAQTSTSSQAPVGTDFKPLTTAPTTKPTFPAYGGSSSPNISGHSYKPLGTSPAYQSTVEASSSPQISPEPKRPAIQTITASSKIVHPDDDMSMEEKRSLLYKYKCPPNMPTMPTMMNGMPMMMPGMSMPPGMTNPNMPRMGAPYTGQNMYPMMGQGGPRPF